MQEMIHCTRIKSYFYFHPAGVLLVKVNEMFVMNQFIIYGSIDLGHHQYLFFSCFFFQVICYFKLVINLLIQINNLKEQMSNLYI